MENSASLVSQLVSVCFFTVLPPLVRATVSFVTSAL